MTDQMFDFEEFAGDFEKIESASLPFLQLESLPNIKTAQLKKLDPPFGWFLTKENADACGFTPSADWIEIELERDGRDESGSEVTISIPGFISRTPRFCTVLESDIEIQEKVPSKRYPAGLWTHRGLAFDDKGKPTRWRVEQQKLRGKDENRWCMLTRRLVLLLDRDNTPLHATPLAFSCRSAWGANLGIELREWRNAVNEKYIEAAQAQGVKISANARLSKSAISYAVFTPTLHWRRTDDSYSPTVCVVGWNAPTNKSEMVGVTRVMTRSPGRKPYELTVTGAGFKDMMVSKASPAGQLIAEWQELHTDFVSPGNAPVGEPKTVVGRAVPATVEASSDGNVKIQFNTNTGSTYIAVVPQHLAMLLDIDGDLELSGLECDGTIRVESAKAITVPDPQAVTASADADYEEMPF